MSKLMPLAERIESLGIKSRVAHGAPPNPRFQNSTGWTVTLRRGDRSMGVQFYMGLAYERQPTTAEVLRSLASDATSYENARSFEDWATDHGLNPDSRSAEAVYRQVVAQSMELRAFLGEADYRALLWETQE